MWRNDYRETKKGTGPELRGIALGKGKNRKTLGFRRRVASAKSGPTTAVQTFRDRRGGKVALKEKREKVLHSRGLKAGGVTENLRHSPGFQHTLRFGTKSKKNENEGIGEKFA